DEDDRRIRAPPLQLPRERERREHVAPGPAARDQVAVGLRRHAECCEMLRRIPTARRSAQSADPPYDRNGSGIPFVGKIERTTEMLTSACTTIITESPRPRRRPNESGAWTAARMPRAKTRPKRTSTNMQPTSPSSSPTIA